MSLMLHVQCFLSAIVCACAPARRVNDQRARRVAVPVVAVSSDDSAPLAPASPARSPRDSLEETANPELAPFWDGVLKETHFEVVEKDVPPPEGGPNSGQLHFSKA